MSLEAGVKEIAKAVFGEGTPQGCICTGEFPREYKGGVPGGKFPPEHMESCPWWKFLMHVHID